MVSPVNLSPMLAIWLALSGLAPAASNDRTPDSLDTGSQEIRIGEESFPYLDEGVGPPLLFLHGAAGELRTWQRHCAMLADEFRCLAYTQRGFGDHKWREDGPAFGAETHARDVIRFVEALKLPAVRLVAWSYAGQVALRAIQLRPDLFAGALLYEPGVLTIVTDPSDMQAIGASFAAFGPVIEAVHAGDNEGAVRELIDASGGPGHFERQTPESQAIELGGAPTMPLIFGGAEPPYPVTCDELGGLERPVAVYWGENTLDLFRIPSRTAAHCLGSEESRTIEGATHLWPDDDPAAFVEAVRQWARSVTN